MRRALAALGEDDPARGDGVSAPENATSGGDDVAAGASSSASVVTALAAVELRRETRLWMAMMYKRTSQHRRAVHFQRMRGVTRSLRALAARRCRGRRREPGRGGAPRSASATRRASRRPSSSPAVAAGRARTVEAPAPRDVEDRAPPARDGARRRGGGRRQRTPPPTALFGQPRTTSSCHRRRRRRRSRVARGALRSSRTPPPHGRWPRSCLRGGPSPPGLRAAPAGRTAPEAPRASGARGRGGRRRRRRAWHPRRCFDEDRRRTKRRAAISPSP